MIRWLPLLLLAACATQPPQVVVGSAPSVEVKVPVIQPCLDPAALEPLPPSAMPPKGAEIDALAIGAYADALRYRDLARRQREQLETCAKVQPTKGTP